MIVRVWLLALLLAGSALAADPVTLGGRAMGTTWTVKFFQPRPPSAPLVPSLVTDRIVSELERLESLFSTYRSTSAISVFNTSRSIDWFPVSPDLARVAHESHRISELTAGAFDATVHSLVHLWGFGPQRRTNHIPTASEINAARAFVGYHRLEVRLFPPAMRKSMPNLAIDFSSIAKGFAVDALGEILTALGATEHLVQIGGDLKATGTRPWRTAIEQPTSTSPSEPAAEPAISIARVFSLAGHALSTSGNFRNFTVLEGRRFGHIIDPRTGQPATSDLASVSVLHPSCATSSALATALFVLGPAAGEALATREQLACLFILHEHSMLTQRATPEFERLAPTSAIERLR